MKMDFKAVKDKLAKFGKDLKKINIAVYVDGPNILRKELSIDLKDVKKAIEQFGRIKIGKVFLNQYDVSMAAEAVECIFNQHIQAIAFVTRDSDFTPAIVKAKRYGKETIVVMADTASAAALKNNADHVIMLGPSKKG